MKRLLSLFFLALPAFALHAAVGEPVPDNSASAAGAYSDIVDGFVGVVLITPDQDWREKWATEEAVAPKFFTTDTLHIDDRVNVLTFYSNPAADDAGEHHILCDVRVIRPDGSLSIEANGLECASGPLQGDPHNVRLTAAVVEFVAEESDQEGVWRIEIGLTDTVRGVSVPLRTHFTLLK